MLHHTMLVTAPAPSQQVCCTQPEFPVGYPIPPLPEGWQIDGGFLQACFYPDEILAQVFPDRHDEHGRETSDAFGRVCSAENGLVPRSDSDSGSELTTPRKRNPVRDITRESHLRSSRFSPAAKKSSHSAGDRQRRRDQANEREKQRIAVMKNAMNVLKNAIPAARKKTKITKLEILKLALEYIMSLKTQLVHDEDPATKETKDGDGASTTELTLNVLHEEPNCVEENVCEFKSMYRLHEQRNHTWIGS